MRKLFTCFRAVIFGLMVMVSQAVASDEPKDYSGDFLTRSNLLGDFGGLRNKLAEKGITADMSFTQMWQGITAGGKEKGGEYGGRGDVVLNFDTEKVGAWKGGLFTIELEGKYDRDVNVRTGAMMEVNSNQTYPSAVSEGINVSQLMFTQFVLPRIGFMIGKIQTGTDTNEFSSGKGDVQFSNIAFTFNPVGFSTMPYTALGAGIVIFPTGDKKDATIKFFAMDANGKPNTTGFDTVFHGNTTYILEERVRSNFFGLTGHHLLGGSYSTKSFTSLDQNLRLVLENRTIQEKSYSWCVYYNFDQYFYEKEKGSGNGVGIFGRFGASDGNPNPVHYFVSAGLGGKGVVPSRSHDSFGIGYYYINVGHPTFVGLFGNRSFLGDEQGFEAYYTIAISPWMKVTPDIQVVRPTQKQMISNGVVKDINTTTIAGIRLQLVF